MNDTTDGMGMNMTNDTGGAKGAGAARVGTWRHILNSQDGLVWPRVCPRGVKPTPENVKHFARVPSFGEWAHYWTLDHGRPPTDEERHRHFINGEWDD